MSAGFRVLVTTGRKRVVNKRIAAKGSFKAETGARNFRGS